VAKVVKTPAVQKWMEDQGLEIAAGPPQEYAERLKVDVAKWKRVVKDARISIK
jgi:tripartite-type tricarboxylate transporter receptor subunit TctC